MGMQTVQTRRFSRQDYERLVADGFFHPEEQLEGKGVILHPVASARPRRLLPMCHPAACMRRSYGTRSFSA